VHIASEGICPRRGEPAHATLERNRVSGDIPSARNTTDDERDDDCRREARSRFEGCRTCVVKRILERNGEDAGQRRRRSVSHVLLGRAGSIARKCARARSCVVIMRLTRGLCGFSGRDLFRPREKRTTPCDIRASSCDSRSSFCIDSLVCCSSSDEQ